MANPIKLTAEEIAAGVKLVQGRKVRPGIAGALADVAESVGRTFGPRQITGRRARINQRVEDEGG